MKTFKEFVESKLAEEACTTSSISGASSDGTKSPEDKKMAKRKAVEDNETDAHEKNEDS